MDLWVFKYIMNTFGSENLVPLAQKFKFAQFGLHAFSQNCPTCTNHNSLSIFSYEADLGLFGKLNISPTTFMLVIFSFEAFILM